MKKEGYLIVLFGAAGDLSRKKLFSAIHSLQPRFGRDFAVLGVSSDRLSDSQFRSLVKKSVKGAEPSFLKRFSYLSGDFTDPSWYGELSARIKGFERRMACNVLFYLAIPPTLFGTVAQNLKKAGLNEPGECWKRIVIEKPFGRDAKTAKELNRQVRGAFDEKQIFRIDHYLGKELVQNILILRFTNGIFEHLWNNDYVDHVQITVAENFGIKGRGGYYDRAGALRDMIQNHLLQTLCLIAMEPPIDINPDSIRDEKLKVLRSLVSFTPASAKKNVVRGQYRGYRREPKVARNSNTETFVALRTEVHNLRWGGVPFYLRTGKNMKTNYAEVNLVLKDLPCVLFCQLPTATLTSNRITIRLQPMEGISLQFNTKIPGGGYLIKPQVMEFCQECKFGPVSSKAYEFLLQDVILGDATRFARWDEVEAAWKWIDTITAAWKKSRARVPFYGNDFGPKESDDLMKRDKRAWINREEPGRLQ